MNETVLVTGGTGFVGSWCVAQLLERGYRVRTTVRDLAAEGRVRVVMSGAVDSATVADWPDRLEVVAADLGADDGWAQAVGGVDVVLHVASPMAATRQEDEVVRPAVDGVVRVLRAARDGGARRVVYTSSCGAVYYGHPAQEEPFDETSWTDVSGGAMERLREVQGPRRAGSLGLHRRGGRRPGADDGQPDGDLRPGPGPGPDLVARARQATPRRVPAGLPEPLVRRRRRPRRGGPAPAGDDRPARR